MFLDIKAKELVFTSGTLLEYLSRITPRSSAMILMHLSHVHYPTDFSQIVILNDYMTLIFMRTKILQRQITRTQVKVRVITREYKIMAINDNKYMKLSLNSLDAYKKLIKFYFIKNACVIKFKIASTEILTSIENEILPSYRFCLSLRIRFLCVTR